MVILGFDFGMKYIGVAVGQSITKTATPLTALTAKDGVPHWEEIQTLIEEWRPEKLVLGIPLNMDGTEQPLTFAAKSFGKKLQQRFTLPLYFVDERLSTWEATHRLRESGFKASDSVPGKKTKKEIKSLNAMAAAVLVEQWISENPPTI